MGFGQILWEIHVESSFLDILPLSRCKFYDKMTYFTSIFQRLWKDFKNFLENSSRWLVSLFVNIIIIVRWQGFISEKCRNKLTQKRITKKKRKKIWNLGFQKATLTVILESILSDLNIIKTENKWKQKEKEIFIFWHTLTSVVLIYQFHIQNRNWAIYPWLQAFIVIHNLKYHRFFTKFQSFT